MMFGILTIVHTADTKKELDADTETLSDYCKAAFVSDVHFKISADGRTEYRFTHRTTENQCGSHVDNGKPCGADAFPGAGDYG